MFNSPNSTNITVEDLEENGADLPSNGAPSSTGAAHEEDPIASAPGSAPTSSAQSGAPGLPVATPASATSQRSPDSPASTPVSATRSPPVGRTGGQDLAQLPAPTTTGSAVAGVLPPTVWRLLVLQMLQNHQRCFDHGLAYKAGFEKRKPTLMGQSGMDVLYPLIMNLEV